MPSSELTHKTVKAAATTTDRGQFSALAAAYSVDRTKERIIPGAFAKTIEAWRASSKSVPLHWDHSGSAADIIGAVDSASMAETKDGLYVEGQVDIEASEVAREAWRSMKNNAVALSFGYLAQTRKGKGGVTEITEVDLFEISIVPAPANADTRLLSLKSALVAEKKIEEPPLDPAELRRRTQEARHELTGIENGAKSKPEESALLDDLVKEREEKEQLRSEMQEKLEGVEAELERVKSLPPEKDLRKRSFKVAHEQAVGELKNVESDEFTEQVIDKAREVLLFLKQNPDLEPDAVSLLSQTVWTKAYIDALPDDHFLHVAGGEKHFAYKDANGVVDLPHLRKALADIRQSKKLTRSRRDSLTQEAHRLIENATKALGPPAVLTDTKPQDTLRSRTFGLALEVANDGMVVKRVEPEVESEPESLDPIELRRRSFELALDVAAG